MGLFNWLMKGMDGEDEENENNSSAPKETKKERKERLKREKMEQRDNRAGFSTEQNSSTAPSSYSYNPDQFNTATHFENGSNFYQQNMGGYGTKNVIFFYPKGYADIQKLVDVLKQGESAVLNLDNISDDESQRMLDFVSGAVYALNGSTQRVSGNIFLLTPEGLNIMVPNETEDD